MWAAPPHILFLYHLLDKLTFGGSWLNFRQPLTPQQYYVFIWCFRGRLKKIAPGLLAGLPICFNLLVQFSSIYFALLDFPLILIYSDKPILWIIEQR